MKVNFYLDTVVDAQGESKILVSICGRGARYQTTSGYKTPPAYWDRAAQRMLDGAVTRRGFAAAEVNAFLESVRRHFEHADSSVATVESIRDEFREFIGRPVPEVPLDVLEFRRSLGAEIASLRAAGGLSQEDLAVRSGMSRHSVVVMEGGGAATSIDSYIKVLSVLGRTLVLASRDGQVV